MGDHLQGELKQRVARVDITFIMQEWTPFIGEKLECQRRANKQGSYAVAIVKRTAGYRTKVCSW